MSPFKAGDLNKLRDRIMEYCTEKGVPGIFMKMVSKICTNTMLHGRTYFFSVIQSTIDPENEAILVGEDTGGNYDWDELVAKVVLFEQPGRPGVYFDAYQYNDLTPANMNILVHSLRAFLLPEEYPENDRPTFSEMDLRGKPRDENGKIIEEEKKERIPATLPIIDGLIDVMTMAAKAHKVSVSNKAPVTTGEARPTSTVFKGNPTVH